MSYTYFPGLIILGLNPSNKNVDPMIPFEGTPSKVNLDKWIKNWQQRYLDKGLGGFIYLIMNLSERVESNQNKFKVAENEKLLFESHINKAIAYNKIICLGDKVYKSVKKLRLRSDIEIIKIPHPSPRNRQLNDKKLVKTMLDKTFKFIIK